MICVVYMEVEKRKRGVVMVEEERESLKKLKGEEGGGGNNKGVVVPTEEEVEEFFAILKRMRVAVKYFDEKEKRKDGKDWREALEQADVTVPDVDDVAAAAEKKQEKVVNEVLDLNAVAPEAAESGGL